MKNYVQPGHVVTVPSAPYNAASGAGLLQGSLFGVCQTAAVSGSPVEIAVDGVFDLPKAASQAWTVGVRVYWDDAAKNCTSTAGSNKLIGVATVAVGSGAGETIGRVLLSGAFTL
jgi:predicted RecA/RadA family phage recombinase